jgi:hypothetical protein
VTGAQPVYRTSAVGFAVPAGGSKARISVGGASKPEAIGVDAGSVMIELSQDGGFYKKGLAQQ